MIGLIREKLHSGRDQSLLLALVVINALVYWLVMVVPAKLVDYYDRPGADGYYLAEAGPQSNSRLILAFLILSLLYGMGWLVAQQAKGRAAWAVVLGGSVVFGGILLFMQPIDAADVYDYIIQGRILGVYGLNPYTTSPSQFPTDPFHNYAAWRNEPATYGPVWTSLSGLAAALAGDGIIANVLLFKLLAGSFLMAGLLVVAAILRRAAPDTALPRTLLLAWNPVVLYSIWGNSHNDSVMVFFILAAAWAICERRYTLAILALVAGALVKFIPILLLPAAGLIALRELPDWRARLRFVAITGLLAALLFVLFYAPFWGGTESFTLTRRARLFTSSIPAVIYYSFRPELGEKMVANIVNYSALFLTASFAIWQGVRALRNRNWDSFHQASFNILAFYLLATNPWFQQWYTVWLISLAPLLLSGRSVVLALIFGFTALSKQLVAGPLLFWPRPKLPQPALEIQLTLIVLGLTWLYALSLLVHNARAAVRSVLRRET